MLYLRYMINENQKTMKTKYRIQNANNTFLNAGTGLDSWFTLETARKLVNYEVGQRIIESDGVNILWEVL
jgi:hypothetical protein